MKDKIRLTESEFREAIKESIRKYLTELDWKTYYNAGRKRDAQFLDKARRGEVSWDNIGTNKTGRETLDYATQKFNDDFGYDEDGVSVYGCHDRRNGMTVNADDDFAFNNKGYKSVYGSVSHDKYGDWRKTLRGVRTRGDRNKTLGQNTPQRKAFDRASKEVDDFNNGNYEYRKGEGWKLKESIDRIVKEAIEKAKN